MSFSSILALYPSFKFFQKNSRSLEREKMTKPNLERLFVKKNQSKKL